MSQDQTRADFEKWAAEKQPWLLDTPENDSDRLLRLTAWEAWKAASRPQSALLSHSAGQAVPEVKYGCHCDLEPGMEPDGCVIDTHERGKCVYARRHDRKEQCEYWRPIKMPAPTKEES